MTTITKINNDSESRRIQRNMTDTQKRNSNYIKEGKLVNAFVKDPNLSLDETIDTLVISEQEIKLPEKLEEIEKKSDKSLFKLAAVSLTSMGILGGFTYLMKNFAQKKMESTKEYLLPGITRNHCINNEIDQSIFSMIQSPNRRTILSAVGVITLSAMAFLAKTFIDGYRDVWIKQREADIQKNLQEKLIAVETQAFSGKIQIIRSMLSSKAKLFAENLKPNFKGVNVKDEERKANQKNTKMNSLAFGALTLMGIVALGYFSIRNIRKSDELIKKGIKNTKEGLENLIKDFNQKKPINPIKGHNGEILENDKAYKQAIENMLESIFAKPAEIEEYVNKMNLSSKEKTGPCRCTIFFVVSYR